ncbi:RHS repeat-associated core domain-containing protein [Pseudomonas putida]|uniref:RHS repeat-associated core domain-containing protein n=1 Tax=Pseudomonas putida TaxID=303 RepID=UPI003839F166
MKPLKTAARFFYSNGAVATLQASGAVSFFRHARLLLGEQAAGLSRLPLVDRAGTVFGVGGVAQDLGYTPYGFLGGKHEARESRTRFVGQLLDQASSSYLLGAGRRIYSPALMRFYSADPLSPFDRGGFNSYVYCLGDPVNRIDPTGKSSSLLSRLTPKFLKRLSPQYRAKKKAQKEAKAKMDVQEAFDKGIEKGREEGFVEGFEAGGDALGQAGYMKGLNDGLAAGAAQGRLFERKLLRNAALSKSMEGVPATEVTEMFADNSTDRLFRTVQDQGMEIRSLSFPIGEGEVITISKPGRR